MTRDERPGQRLYPLIGRLHRRAQRQERRQGNSSEGTMQQMRLQRRVVPPGTLCASSHGTGIFWFPATCTTTRDVERRRADSTRPRRRFQPPTACAEASSAGSKRPECGTAHARITVSEGARVVIDIVLYLNSAAPARRQGLAGRARWPRVQLRRPPGLQSESLLEGGVRGVRAHSELHAGGLCRAYRSTSHWLRRQDGGVGAGATGRRRG